ncbi:MAG: hypothetical protein ACJAZ2_001858 [Glaciecola sp.]|jgi:hypothetical protein
MDTKLQFDGFLNTPSLWKTNPVNTLHQFPISRTTPTTILPEFNPNLPLGKLVEQFVFHALNEDPSAQILSQNLQIQKGKISIGEIDCLLKQSNQVTHLEIVYKFYLYDENIPGTDLHKWIGPNRNDNLIKKLTKLKDKQLPLLFKDETQKTLTSLHGEMNFQDMLQKVLFKAQLFAPINLLSSSFPSINNNCIKGFYISFDELMKLKPNTFHISDKRNWLTDPHLNVEWIEFESLKSQIEIYHSKSKSPLCWLKNPNGTMQKFFVVWW